MDYIRKQNAEQELLLKQAIKSLEEDKELKAKHIGALTLEVDKLKLEVQKMEFRLDKQVEVDQQIERELQDEIVALKNQNRELRKECKVLNEEYSLMEQQVFTLKRETHEAKDASKRLEKIVYGKRTATSAGSSGARKPCKETLANFYKDSRERESES